MTASANDEFPREVWLILYCIDAKWQDDGEWFRRRADALAVARDNQKYHGWGFRLRRIRPGVKP